MDKNQVDHADQQADRNNGQSTLNTFLIGIVMLGISGVFAGEISSGKDISAIKAGQVTRPEIEAKFTVLNTQIEEMKSNYADVKTRLALIESEQRRKTP
jgi:hypothetical protein